MERIKLSKAEKQVLRELYKGYAEFLVLTYEPYYDSVQDWEEVEEALLHFLYSWHDAIKPRITKLSYVSSENFKV